MAAMAPIAAMAVMAVIAEVAEVGCKPKPLAYGAYEPRHAQLGYLAVSRHPPRTPASAPSTNPE